MREFTITVLEDDFYQMQLFEQMIRDHFPHCILNRCRDLKDIEESLGTSPPDVAVIDWVIFGRDGPSPSDYSAGLRAVESLRKVSTGKEVQIIIRTLMASYSIAPYLKKWGVEEIPVLGKSMSDDQRLVKMIKAWGEIT